AAVRRGRGLARPDHAVGMEVRPAEPGAGNGDARHRRAARLLRVLRAARDAQLPAERPVIAPAAAVTVREVSKWFSRRVLALDRVSFEVPVGSLFGLLGPNGAGKTTLFSIAADFLKASGGTIEILGIDSRRVSDLRGRVSMLPQDASFQGAVPV